MCQSECKIYLQFNIVNLITSTHQRLNLSRNVLESISAALFLSQVLLYLWYSRFQSHFHTHTKLRWTSVALPRITYSDDKDKHSFRLDDCSHLLCQTQSVASVI